jgi:hypothetical protein
MTEYSSISSIFSFTFAASRCPHCLLDGRVPNSECPAQQQTKSDNQLKYSNHFNIGPYKGVCVCVYVSVCVCVCVLFIVYSFISLLAHLQGTSAEDATGTVAYLTITARDTASEA